MVPIPLRSQLCRLTPIVALSNHPSSRDVRSARQFKAHLPSTVIHSGALLLLKLLVANHFQDCVCEIVLMRASQRILCRRAGGDSLISKVIRARSAPDLLFINRRIRNFQGQELQSFTFSEHFYYSAHGETQFC